MEVFNRLFTKAKQYLIKGFNINGGRGNWLNVSHLLFVDKTLIFYKNDVNIIDTRNVNIIDTHARPLFIPSH